MTGVLEFDGEAFDAVRSGREGAPEPQTATPVVPRPGPGDPTPPRPGAVGPDPADGPTGLVARIRDGVVAAHAAALDAQLALQRRMLHGLGAGTSGVAGAAGAPVLHWPRAPVGEAPPVPAPPTSETAFKPLARSTTTRLDAADLARLAAGEVAAVFGPPYDQQGANPHLRLGAGGPLGLAAVEGIGVRGGASGRGTCRATAAGAADLGVAAGQAAEVLALHLGLHLSLPDVELVTNTGAPPTGSPPTGSPPTGSPPTGAPPTGAQDTTLRIDVTGVGLLPRPWLTARAALLDGGDTVLGWIPDVSVEVRERPGSMVGPDADGTAAFLGRVAADGTRALLGEFQLAHCAHGDPGTAFGAPFARYNGRRATRLPSGGLLLVDRIVDVDGERGRLDAASYRTEYDAPADSWYFADSGNADVPNCVLMETSLQSALLVGYYLGVTLTDPGEDYSLRNLGGHGTLLREIDLRDRTIRQHSRLCSTTLLPGSLLQEFSYDLSVAGEPYYRGGSMFGYFTAEALRHQTGLDGGRSVPTWLETQGDHGGPTPATRTIDVAGRRARGPVPGEPAPPAQHLALLDDVTVVDGGGRHGLGYLHAVRPIDPDDWFFARHFHLDPVVPGSLGVEQVLQAVGEWAIDAGLADELAGETGTAPDVVVPVGATLSWRYRGQILPTDGESTLDVHLTDVSRRPGRIRISAEASLWKPGLRIYELDGVAVELRAPGAPPW